MGGAAGANIVSWDGDNTHRAGQWDFASVFQIIQPGLWQIGGINPDIFPDCFVSKAFYLLQLFRGQNAVKIEGDILVPYKCKR